jgi:hypothetical protein
MMDAHELLKLIYETGCPTYRDNSGSRSRDGCAICVFCDANLELKDDHAEDCLWMKVAQVVE